MYFIGGVLYSYVTEISVTLHCPLVPELVTEKATDETLSNSISEPLVTVESVPYLNIPLLEEV